MSWPMVFFQSVSTFFLSIEKRKIPLQLFRGEYLAVNGYASIHFFDNESAHLRRQQVIGQMTLLKWVNLRLREVIRENRSEIHTCRHRYGQQAQEDIIKKFLAQKLSAAEIVLDKLHFDRFL